MSLTEVINCIAKEVTTRNRDIIGLRRVRHRIIRRQEKALLGKLLERRRRGRRFVCRVHRHYCSTRDPRLRALTVRVLKPNLDEAVEDLSRHKRAILERVIRLPGVVRRLGVVRVRRRREHLRRRAKRGARLREEHAYGEQHAELHGGRHLGVRLVTTTRDRLDGATPYWQGAGNTKHRKSCCPVTGLDIRP